MDLYKVEVNFNCQLLEEPTQGLLKDLTPYYRGRDIGGRGIQVPLPLQPYIHLYRIVMHVRTTAGIHIMLRLTRTLKFNTYLAHNVDYWYYIAYPSLSL